MAKMHPTAADLIKMARANIKSIGKGKLSGAGADIALVLFADKYHKVYKTKDETLADFVRKSETIPAHRKREMNLLFKGYYDLLTHKEEKKKDPAKILGLQSWIYVRVLEFLYELEYESSRKGAIKGAAMKNKIKDMAKLIWIENGRKRTNNEAIRIKIELEKQGHERSSDTIYDWICGW